MKFVPFEDAKKFKVGNGMNGSVAWEYDTDNPNINTAWVEVLGRYPLKGRKKNTECAMVVMVIRGKGQVVIEGRTIEIKKKDVIQIDPNERYFWQANKDDYLILIPASHPAWRPEQNEDCE